MSSTRGVCTRGAKQGLVHGLIKRVNFGPDSHGRVDGVGLLKDRPSRQLQQFRPKFQQTVKFVLTLEKVLHYFLFINLFNPSP